MTNSPHPDVVLRIAGSEMDARFWDTVVELRVSRTLSRPSLVEIRMLVPPFDEGTFPAAGDELELKSADGKINVSADVTRVDQHFDASGAQLRRIVALDRLDRLRYRQTVRSLTKVSGAELAAEVISGAGMTLLDEPNGSARSSRPANPNSPNTPQFGECHQYLESDLDFLVGQLAGVGWWLSTTGTSCRLVSLAHPEREEKFVLGSDITELTISESTDRVANAVRCASWDPWLAEAAETEVAQPSFESPRLASVAESRVRRVHHGRASDRSMATHVAQATLDQAAAQRQTVAGVAAGGVAIAPGIQAIFLDENGATLASPMITSVEHRMSGLGITTSFTSVPPALEPATRGADRSAILRGVITAVDDPDQRGRVRVELPTVGGIVTPWVDVVLPGVSGTRGFIAVPEEGDNVAVAVLNGDVTQAVVLGSTFGRSGPPRKTVKGRRVRGHAWHTSRSQFVSLDDAAGAVTAQNRRGSRLRLGAKESELHSETDLVIAAPGRTITIRAAAVAFEQE